MKILVSGLGYIGLPTAVMFAKNGCEVVGLDINEGVVNKLNKGILHLEEPGLASELKSVVKEKKFRATLHSEKADVFIISVPTPNIENALKSCDLSYVKAAVNTVSKNFEKGNVVIIESTIPPRTMSDIILPLVEEKGLVVGKDIYLAHCPERVLPGQILHELVYNNRIVGGITPECTKKASEVYATFVKGELLKTDSSSAELSKLMENTYRDVNIALSNELVKVCNQLDINALEVIRLANKHPRVNLHQPGPGVGGHCLAVDPYFISATIPSVTPLIQEARKINSTMPYYITNIVTRLVKNQKIKRMTVFGATYKGNIDDVRESPALEIYEYLEKNLGIQVSLHDPHVHQEYSLDLYDALEKSEFLLILVDHDEFKNIPEEVLNRMDRKLVFDTKNIMQNTNQVEFYNMGTIQKILS
ncbi:nucleotide sugar dehydrogenase [Enterococcus faecalis]|nr:nucleotide sugar dehydrogenase [Enterococcus faecalis]